MVKVPTSISKAQKKIYFDHVGHLAKAQQFSAQADDAEKQALDLHQQESSLRALAAFQLYPHHNLYFINSTEWDLRALQAVLLSEVTHIFINLYSTKMHGGYMRLQAQYLTRLRIPHWRDVSPSLRAQLIAAGEARDLAACNVATATLYKLNKCERQEIEVPPGEANDA